MVNKTIRVEIIRKAIAKYMATEGCSCCEGQKHNEDKKVIAELLGIPMYKDGSGYDFYQFANEEAKKQ